MLKTMNVVVLVLFVVVISIDALLFGSCTLAAEVSTNLEGSAVQQRIAVLREGLAGLDIQKKQESILSLGKLGGEAVPVLLEQLGIELKRKERVSVGGEAKDVESGFLASVILALGYTRDRRSIPPLIDIALSEGLSANARWEATRVLAVLGSPELSSVPSTFIPQAEPTKGYEVTEKDREEVEGVLIKVLRDREAAVRMEATIGLGLIGDREIIPVLRSLARKDPYSQEVDASLLGGKKGERIRIYPVREEARKILKRLETKKRSEAEGEEKGKI